MSKLEGNVVFPGTFVATAEEFLPGKNAFEDKGHVMSECIGVESPDMFSRVFNVNKVSRAVSPINVGSTVIGVVERVKDKAVMMRIVDAYDGGGKRISPVPSAQLPVFNIANQYVESTRDMFRAGDIVSAKVSEVAKYMVAVDTKDDDSGVILAFCSKCRQPLKRSGSGLECSDCCEAETRKVSSDYQG